MCTHQKQHTQRTKIANRAGGGSRVHVAVTEKQACDASNAPRAAGPAPPAPQTTSGKAEAGRQGTDTIPDSTVGVNPPAFPYPAAPTPLSVPPNRTQTLLARRRRRSIRGRRMPARPGAS